ncbi:MAG: flagellar hook capping FlgD N-terminal domain-containing protein [Eubacteriales bacterium]
MSTAYIVDGTIVDTSASATSLSTTTASNSTDGSTLDKDAFLQLLVVQMQYQDPLEPTSNTEYISQLATFSELEEMQNLSTNMELQRASALVGQEVIIAVTSDTTGSSTYVRGPVDYVQIENGNAYLSVNGSLYSLDDLDSVADSTYLDAADKAYLFVVNMSTLPTVANLTISDMDTIDAMMEEYDAMSDYELSFLGTDVQTSVEEYREKMDELKLVNGLLDDDTETEDTEVEDTDVEDTEAV